MSTNDIASNLAAFNNLFHGPTSYTIGTNITVPFMYTQSTQVRTLALEQMMNAREYKNPYVDRVGMRQVGLDHNNVPGRMKKAFRDFLESRGLKPNEVEGRSLNSIQQYIDDKKMPNLAWLDKRVNEMRVRL